MSKSLWLSSRNHQPSPCAAVAVWWCCVISRSLESLLHYSCPVHNMSAARMHKRVCTPLTQTRSRKHFPRKTQKKLVLCWEKPIENKLLLLSVVVFFFFCFLSEGWKLYTSNSNESWRTSDSPSVLPALGFTFYPTHSPNQPTSSSSTSLSFLKCRCFDALCAALPKFYPLASHFLIFKKYQKKNEKEKRGLRRGRISFTASQLTQPIGNCCISLIGSRY